MGPSPFRSMRLLPNILPNAARTKRSRVVSSRYFNSCIYVCDVITAGNIFSLDISIFPIILLLYIVTFFLILQNLWTITLEKSIKAYSVWSGVLALCLAEIAAVLWFWPTSSTVIAIFLTGFFYTIVGPAQIWLEKRLFRGVLWEYVWVGIIVFSILLSFTFWKGR